MSKLQRQGKADRIKLCCPNGHQLRGKLAMRGRTLQCPVCSTSFTVPADLEPAWPQGVLVNSIGLRMKLVPAGKVRKPASESGAPEDSSSPDTRLITEAYYIGVYPVTQDEFQTVVGSNPSRIKGKRHPVNDVRWFEAIEFCNLLSRREGMAPYYQVDDQSVSIAGGTGYRLPTEHEWEYACRAGTRTPWSFGDEKSRIGDYAWYDGNSNGKTHPVGQKKPNPWGFYDMHGNVWEWCWDCHEDSAARSASTSSDQIENPYRVLRGGSYCLTADELRSTFRYSFDPSLRGIYLLGFRVSRTCPAAP